MVSERNQLQGRSKKELSEQQGSKVESGQLTLQLGGLFSKSVHISKD
jgi:hypothetical protein